MQLDTPDLASAPAVIDLFDRAADALRRSPLRRGSVDELPREGRLLATGDLHDHHEHLRKIIGLAELDQSPSHHVLVHEVIHGPHRIAGRDLSYRTLARIAQLVLDYPSQVHPMLGNHELAQLRGGGILKGDVDVVAAFHDGLDHAFGEDARRVGAAVGRLIRAMALGMRCANGVMCSHSLPSPRRLSMFDPAVLDRSPADEDYQPLAGSAYLLVWGRGLTQEVADALAEQWGVSVFVLGHQPAEQGYAPCGRTMLILNSDHERGVALPIELSRTYTREELIEQVIFLRSLPSWERG